MAAQATEIKKYVQEAMRNIANFDAGNKINGSVVRTGKGAHAKTDVVIPSGYGEIVVKLVPHTVFTRSYYEINHPTLGRFQGLLNGVTARMGEYGVTAGKPKPI